MPQVVYCGPHDEVDVPALRLRAKPGAPIEVSDDAAASLLDQPANWQPVKAGKSVPAVAGQEG